MKDNRLIPSLNGVRGLCLILLLGAHAKYAPNFPPEWLPLLVFFDGGIAVNVFFTLSGFLITYLLVEEEKKYGRVSLRHFYLRRTLRIFPLYFFVLAVYFVLQLWNVLHFTAGQWVSSLTYTKNFGAGSWVDGHFWSLAVEEQFYLLWPFVFRYFSRKGRLVFALVCIFSSPVFRALSYLYLDRKFTDHSFFTNMDCLMIGCMAGLYLTEIRNFLDRFQPRTMRFIAVSVIAVIWFLQLYYYQAYLTLPFGKTMISLSTSLLIVSLGFYQSGTSFRLLNTKFLSWLGILSYSVYLWQQLFFAKEILPFSLLPYNLILIFAVAIISHQFIEKPFLRLKHRFQTAGTTADLPGPAIFVKQERGEEVPLP